MGQPGRWHSDEVGPEIVQVGDVESSSAKKTHEAKELKGAHRREKPLAWVEFNDRYPCLLQQLQQGTFSAQAADGEVKTARIQAACDFYRLLFSAAKVERIHQIKHAGNPAIRLF
jgi:hypothetical protein